MIRLWLLLFTLVTGPALACSVPVFRYALEHWPADPFQITVLHKGALTAEQKIQIPIAPLANAKMRMINLETETGEDALAFWKEQKTDKLPWLVVQFPRITGISASVIAGPLAEVAPLLFESPARREVIDRLAAGESAVWVLLESGDKAKDEAAAELLEKRLEYLMGVMTLPKLDAQDIANGLVSIAEEDLLLDFSVLRVSRADGKERLFTQMLIASEPGLAELREPMVFPIFGRGRSLYALVGAGIRQETIEAAASFLIGKCSCQVKEQNPGVDLLLTADWDKLVKTPPDLAEPLPTLAEVVKTSPESVTAIPAQTTAPENSIWMLVLFYAISPLFLGLAMILILKKKKSR
jgi:hypothetical protein